MLIATNEILTIFRLKKAKAVQLRRIISSKLSELQLHAEDTVETTAKEQPRALISFKEMMDIHEQGLNCYQKMLLAKF